VRLFPVTVDDGIDIHVNASYFQAQGVRQLHFISKFGFHSYHGRKSNFTDVRKMRKGAAPSQLQQTELDTFVEQTARIVSIFCG
jgi:hypothetical protein